MKSPGLRTLTGICGLIIALGSEPAVAQSLDALLDCRASPHAFVDDLMEGKKIALKPMRVEANSVNAFKAARGSGLTALGFNVYAVLGFQADDPLFQKGSGQAREKPLYGVVVSASIDAVAGKIQSAGIHPIVRQVMPMVLTAIVCEP